MTRNPFIDYLKGILIVLVTIGHAFQFAIYQDERIWSNGLCKAIYMFHMPLFMGISGYLSYTGILKAKFSSFATIKIKSYLIPIAAWAILYRCADYAMEADFGLIHLPQVILGEIFSSLWFIWALLGSLLLTAAIHSIGRGFWFFYLLSLVLVLLLPEAGNLVMFKFMYPYFQLGFLFASRQPQDWSESSRRWVAVGAFGVAGLCFYFWNRDSYIYFSGMKLASANLWNIGLRYLGGCATSIVAIEILRTTYGKLSPTLDRGIEVLGRESIYIYILQGYAYIILGRIFAKWVPPIHAPFHEILIGISLGIFVACGCWLGGRVISQHPIMGLVLFGKPMRPK